MTTTIRNSNKNSSSSTYTTTMRITSTGRPYAKDMFDLFAALLIQLPMTEHRSFFRSYPHTFTTEESLKQLAHLEFTNDVRTVDPSDPTRHLATRTTTTFSMSGPMAKSLGTYFLGARLVEDAVNPQNRSMKDKGIWRMTPKGKFMIQEFSQRAQVSIDHMQESLNRVGSFKIFQLERLRVDDRLTFSRVNLTNAFRTMLAWLPTERLIADDLATNVKEKNVPEYQYTFFGYQCFEWLCEYTTIAAAEEAQNIAAEFVLYGWISEITDRPEGAGTFKMTRSTLYFVTERGQAVLDWNDHPPDKEGSITSSDKSVSDKSDVVQMKQVHASRLLPTETHANPEGTVSATVLEDTNESMSDTAPLILNAENNLKYNFGFGKSNSDNEPEDSESPPSIDEGEIDEITRKLLKLQTKGGGDSQGEDIMPLGVHHQPKDSQWMRLRQVLLDPLLRMYFRDFMKASFCEENLNFWVDYQILKRKCRAQASSKDLFTECYRIYGTYLGPDSQAEVNIDHQLHQEIIQLVTSSFKVAAGPATMDLPFSSGAVQITTAQKIVVVREEGTLESLLALFDKVNDHICRTMAQDSVPRFAKTQKYRELVANGTIHD